MDLPVRRRRERVAQDGGFSLLEVLLAGALTAVVGSMALLWLLTINRTATDFTAEQQAENDLRFILDRAVAEFADARPPVRCVDDPLPATAEDCRTWGDHWDVDDAGVPIYTANSRVLCFYALTASGTPPNPAATPDLEGRCIRAKEERLEVVVADVSYDAQLVSSRPTSAVDSDAPARVLGFGLEPGQDVFSYGRFDGSTVGLATDTHNIAAVEMTLTHGDVSLRSNADDRQMSATLAVRANRYSPFQTPTYGVPGPVTMLAYIATDMTFTVTWSAPGSGGAPTGYEVQQTSNAPQSDSACSVDTTAMTIDFVGRMSNTAYTVWVRACNAVGAGPWLRLDAMTLP